MLRNRIIMLSGLKSFLITSKDGAPDNQYRIRDHQVEFRSLDANGPPGPGRSWRVLEADEIELHFALETPVAAWLDKVLYGIKKAA
jgi:hypothetical protein